MNKPMFTYQPDSGSARHAYRARVPGLEARAGATQLVYPVHDISATGMSLDDEAGRLEPGNCLEFDVLLKDHVIITGLKASVARRQDRLAGLKFTDLTRRQEERLDKLVLEVQKHMISKSKIGGSHIDDENET